MTPQARERAYYETSLKLLSLRRTVEHAARISPKGFPQTHLLSVMKALPVRRAMGRAYAEWQADGSGG
jgi:hypothetical protein